MFVRSVLSKTKCLHNLNVVEFFPFYVNGITVLRVTNTWNFHLWQCDRIRQMEVRVSHRHLKLQVSQHKFIYVNYIVFFSFLLPFHFSNIEPEVTFWDSCAFANITVPYYLPYKVVIGVFSTLYIFTSSDLLLCNYLLSYLPEGRGVSLYLHIARVSTVSGI